VHIISTNNIAIGMVRGGRKIRFRPPKVRFQSTLYPETFSFFFSFLTPDRIHRLSPSSSLSSSAPKRLIPHRAHAPTASPPCPPLTARQPATKYTSPPDSRCPTTIATVFWRHQSPADRDRPCRPTQRRRRQREGESNRDRGGERETVRNAVGARAA
jgi:hypothetical protein